MGSRKINSLKFIVTTLLEIQNCDFFQTSLTGHDHFMVCLKQLFEKGSLRWRSRGNGTPPPTRWKPVWHGLLHISASGIRNQAMLPLGAMPVLLPAVSYLAAARAEGTQPRVPPRSLQTQVAPRMCQGRNCNRCRSGSF